MKQSLELLTRAYQYPRPGQLDALREAAEGLPDGAVKAKLGALIERLAALDLREWEELYTATLDLSPRLVAYVGHAAYGDDYRRGTLMAALNREYVELGVEVEGELPDHLVPILHYLARASEPLPELVELLGPALQKMHKALKSEDPDNPYLLLLEATEPAVASVLIRDGDSDPAVVALRR